MTRVLVPVLLLVLVLAGCSASPDAGAEKGPERLPDVTLQPLGDGDPVALRDLRGPMVVNLWASWCVPCERELPVYQQFATKYADQIDVLGIDFQDNRRDKARAMIAKAGVTYPLVSDPDGEMRARFMPQLILLDEQGEVAFEKYVEITSVAQLEKLVETHLEVPAA